MVPKRAIAFPFPPSRIALFSTPNHPPRPPIVSPLPRRGLSNYHLVIPLPPFPPPIPPQQRSVSLPHSHEEVCPITTSSFPYLPFPCQSLLSRGLSHCRTAPSPRARALILPRQKPPDIPARSQDRLPAHRLAPAQRHPKAPLPSSDHCSQTAPHPQQSQLPPSLVNAAARCQRPICLSPSRR